MEGEKEITIEGKKYFYSEKGKFAEGSTCNIFVASTKATPCENVFLKVAKGEEPVIGKNSQASKVILEERAKATLKTNRKIIQASIGKANEINRAYPNYFIDWKAIEGNDDAIYCHYTLCESFEQYIKDIFSSNKVENLMLFLTQYLNVIKHVSAIHKQNYVHFDLKAGNILVLNDSIDASANIRIIDFDSAVSAIILHEAKSVEDIGFRSTYLTEEMIKNIFDQSTAEERFDNYKKCDVYCLGKILSQAIELIVNENQYSESNFKLDLFKFQLKKVVDESRNDDFNKIITLEALEKKIEYIIKTYKSDDDETIYDLKKNRIKVLNNIAKRICKEKPSILESVANTNESIMSVIEGYSDIDAMIEDNKAKVMYIYGGGGVGKSTRLKKYFVDHTKECFGNDDLPLCFYIKSNEEFPSVLETQYNIGVSNNFSAIIIFDGINEAHDKANIIDELKKFQSANKECSIIFSGRKEDPYQGTIENKTDDNLKKCQIGELSEYQVSKYLDDKETSYEKLGIGYEILKNPMALTLAVESGKAMANLIGTNSRGRPKSQIEEMLNKNNYYGLYDGEKLNCETKADIIANFITINEKETENKIEIDALKKIAFDCLEDNLLYIDISNHTLRENIKNNCKSFYTKTESNGKTFLEFSHEDYRDVLQAMYVCEAIKEFVDKNEELNNQINEKLTFKVDNEMLTEFIDNNSKSENAEEYKRKYLEESVEERKKIFNESRFKEVFTPINFSDSLSNYVVSLLGYDFDKLISWFNYNTFEEK